MSFRNLLNCLLLMSLGLIFVSDCRGRREPVCQNGRDRARHPVLDPRVYRGHHERRADT